MPPPMSDETVLLREAIRQVLSRATEPLYTDQIHSSHAVSSLGLAPERTTAELMVMFRAKHERVDRIRSPNGRCLWAYFDPRVCTPLERQPRKPVVVAPAADKLEFNPIEADELDLGGPIPPSANVQVPPGVKAIAISIGGVSLRIELTA